jgi:hypothetical protein
MLMQTGAADWVSERLARLSGKWRQSVEESQETQRRR